LGRVGWLVILSNTDFATAK